jgi:hypothetical protein
MVISKMINIEKIIPEEMYNSQLRRKISLIWTKDMFKKTIWLL